MKTESMLGAITVPATCFLGVIEDFPAGRQARLEWMRLPALVMFGVLVKYIFDVLAECQFWVAFLDQKVQAKRHVVAVNAGG